MKTQFKCTWLNYLSPSVKPIKRERIAYLLRAARSRWSHNIERIGKGYIIRDSQFHIIPS